MGDLAQRPRGGWQFGNRPRGAKHERPRDDQGRPLLPDGRVDPDPSCYGVTRAGVGVFHIRHYLDPDDEKPCCAMEVTRSPRDVGVAHAEGIDVDIVTLRRAPDCVKTKKAADVA
jgi:hypothetical protein